NGFFLAMAHWRSGDYPKAMAYFDRSVFWMDAYAPSRRELIRFRAEAEALLDTSRPRPDFREVLGDLPARAYSLRGQSLGAQGRWPAALADLRRALEGGGARGNASASIDRNSLVWLRLAALELELGDREAYRRRCRQMIDRFGHSTDAYDLERT